MGVRRLQTFLEKHCPEACYQVSIEELANDFRLTHNREPVIVVDGSSCFRKFYGDLDWVCGGQFKEYVDIITRFIDGFARLAIELIIFFDGATQESKRPVWISRRLATIEKAHNVIDALKAGCEVNYIDKELFVLPAGLGNVMSSICATRCTVRRSIRECDEEIAEYAERNKCLAILAQDSDFVIYQGGGKFYLSSEKLDIDSMTTLAYDRQALARNLNLDISQLPILASLMGNDLISADHLRPFHRRLTGRQQHQAYTAVLVQRIAQYIQSLPKRKDSFKFLQQLSIEVFNGPHRAGDLKQSILSYETKLNRDNGRSQSICEKWHRILSLAHTSYTEMTAPSHIYNILRRLPFEMSTALEDCRIAMPPSAVALRLMRQRLYGVALREYPGQSYKDILVKEWCVSGPESLRNAKEVSGIPPPEESPNLLELWEGDSCTLTESKFKLLAWIGSTHLSSINLRTLPHQIISAACILSYLYHDAGLLCNWEVKVFASVVVDVQAMSSQELSLIKVKNIHVRGVQLATMFTRSIVHLMLANSLCGSPIHEKWMKHPQLFDGKLFQVTYMNGEKVPIVPKKGSLQHFNQLCEIILG